MSLINRFRKKTVNIVMGVALFMSASMVDAAGTMQVFLEGCEQPPTYYQPQEVYDTDPYYPNFSLYFCDPSDYVRGNLGQWAELDMVPHRLVFDSTNRDTNTSFTFGVGGDYKDTSDPTIVAWDYISRLTLDENSTRALNEDGDAAVATCRTIGSTAVQSLQIEPDNSTIYRMVTVDDFPPGVICVAIYNMRLAIGSSRYPGSSIRSKLVGDLGAKSLPLPVALPFTFGKTMSATQAGSRTWTVSKSSSSGDVTFDNTCDDSLPLNKDVNITVTWTKGELTPEGNVSISTVISASSSASRDLMVSIVDTLYSGTTQTNQVGQLTCPTVTIPADSGIQPICTHTFVIPADYEVYNDVAVATFLETDANITYPGYTPPTITASAVAFVQGTSQGGDDNATITDNEWITGNDLSYSVVTPTSGSFVNYSAGEITNGEVNWTSGLEAEESNGSVTFTKTIYVPYAAVTTGTLSDRATLRTGGGTVTTSGQIPQEISLTALAKVNLTITKTMLPDDIPDGQTLDFNFTVVNGFDFNETFTLEVNDTEPNASITFEGIPPALYGVSEHSKVGYAVVGNSVRVVDLTVDGPIPHCSGSVTFVNEKAGRPGVIAYKVTDPVSIGGVDQNSSWNMRLEKWNDDTSSWDPVVSNMTDEAGMAILVEPDNLDSGVYRVREDLNDGWYQIGSLGSGCDFNYTIDMNVSTYECVFANAMYGTVIINKEFVEGSTAADFNFTQTIKSGTLVLGTTTTKEYLNIQAGQYTVTETDPKVLGPSPSYDLTSLVCTESLGDGEEDDDTTTSLSNRRANIDLDPGETIECTFTNQERGRINLLKTEDGNETAELWTFTLESVEDGIIEHSTTTGLDFSDARLYPGRTYTLCEVNVKDSWDANWSLNGNDVTADLELIPHEGHIDRCYDFNVSVGETAEFEIDNISPASSILGDYVWFDDNNNGIQDGGEDPVEGMMVELLDGAGSPVTDIYDDGIKYTGPDGSYHFTVEPGEYRVRFSGIPSNYLFSPMHSGSDAAADSDADSSGVTGIIVMSGEDNLTIDAGIYCTCFDTESRSDGSPALNVVTGTLMILLTLMIGLYFVRREEQLNGNER